MPRDITPDEIEQLAPGTMHFKPWARCKICLKPATRLIRYQVAYMCPDHYGSRLACEEHRFAVRAQLGHLTFVDMRPFGSIPEFGLLASVPRVG